MMMRTKPRLAALRSCLARLATRLLPLAMLALCSSSAMAWWNDEWEMRKKITIDASAAGATSLLEVRP
jgi:biopolymer transport protein ExbB